jgi:murein DD-endopeptidase MepM/ murein hydrolase activator NlpD
MALLLVIGALVANAAIKSSKSVSSQGILGGPLLTGSTEDLFQATFVGVPQVISSAEAADRAEVIDNLSTPTLSDDLAGLGGDSVASAGAKAVLDEHDHDEEEEKKAAAPKLATPARYFVQPASGLNWGTLHGRNAVDIANVCGTAVVAAASGVVIDGDGSGNWNGGYGNFIFVQHANGSKTKYAHLRSLQVSVGDEVSRGQEIGKMGNTGRSTGCHLHFEVYGATNPFARR